MGISFDKEILDQSFLLLGCEKCPRTARKNCNLCYLIKLLKYSITLYQNLKKILVTFLSLPSSNITIIQVHNIQLKLIIVEFICREKKKNMHSLSLSQKHGKLN